MVVDSAEIGPQGEEIALRDGLVSSSPDYSEGGNCSESRVSLAGEGRLVAALDAVRTGLTFLEDHGESGRSTRKEGRERSSNSGVGSIPASDGPSRRSSVKRSHEEMAGGDSEIVTQGCEDVSSPGADVPQRESEEQPELSRLSSRIKVNAGADEDSRRDLRDGESLEFEGTIDSDEDVGSSGRKSVRRRLADTVTVPSEEGNYGVSFYPSVNDNPDSVSGMVAELERLIHYVMTKDKLRRGKASFMRDYLRTYLISKSALLDRSMHQDSADRSEWYAGVECLPDEVLKHVFSFLDGRDLSRCLMVSKRWNELASDDNAWKALCLQQWRSLETDPALWRLIDPSIDMQDPNKWRKVYPLIIGKPQWKCKLQKTGRFICHLIAHQIGGQVLGDEGIPSVLIVERRFNIAHLRQFVAQDSPFLYFEPETESDRIGYEEFIDYLVKRTRAGLALENDHRYIFVPPCDYSRDLNYEGTSLLGIVQT
mmetsp:Transcript_18120/g.37684  ORF Transcript_18120/g.37684 Transcript_18120/m.37684 type:complete len:482 (+) Transcript_18120:499-1944(+)